MIKKHGWQRNGRGRARTSRRKPCSQDCVHFACYAVDLVTIQETLCFIGGCSHVPSRHRGHGRSHVALRGRACKPKGSLGIGSAPNYYEAGCCPWPGSTLPSQSPPSADFPSPRTYWLVSNHLPER
ncbi:hypothetical protein PMIN01_01645 [Paraphaeosphaeria minitans]|uniref:Uncharacterized protein n=1 Tax=Paraphaeosphaeria minitans TaxID=565426 RepID=A0A9P6GNP8_9PLEO|nr:hypothetical protein PMIN01_01645 [Paraphaeosphaeria minitans]